MTLRLPGVDGRLALKLERACRVQLLAEAAGGPKLLADGDDLRQKGRRANRADLHVNMFNYLVRRWHRQCCVNDQAGGHSARA